eukprot:UN34421
MCPSSQPYMCANKYTAGTGTDYSCHNTPEECYIHFERGLRDCNATHPIYFKACDTTEYNLTDSISPVGIAKVSEESWHYTLFHNAELSTFTRDYRSES